MERKVAIVTGAGRGIGREEAVLLASEGARVVVNDVGAAPDGSTSTERPADAVVNEIRQSGGDAIVHYDDISTEEGAGGAVDLALSTWGRLDVVVNNAGIMRDKMIFNMTVEDWDVVMSVHTRGTFLCSRAACIHWRNSVKAGAPPGGRIINTSSFSGLAANVGQANYSAAKAAITMLTRVIALEMGRYGVTANAIVPGARTRLTESAYGKLASGSAFDPFDPAHVAPLVGYLATDGASAVTGQVIGIYGPLLQLYDAWQCVAQLREQTGWSIASIASRIDELFDGRSSQYEVQESPLRELAGITSADLDRRHAGEVPATGEEG